jgi:protein-L-isoaspartate(D-aspartate) O-methyltransferase
MRVASLALIGALGAACTRASPPSAETSLRTDAATPLADPDPESARAMRAELVAAIQAKGWLKSDAVRGAMLRVPRHRFMPLGTSLADAYADVPFPIGHAQTISQPSIVAEMTDALELHGTERVLEIGTGSGYQAAILSLLAREVYSIEIVRELGEEAEKRLRALGHANIHLRIGDGYAGWPQHAPFDRIVLTAAPAELPRVLTDQLADGGVLVAPIGEVHETQTLVRIRKRDGKLTRERLDVVRFVPMVKGEGR